MTPERFRQIAEIFNAARRLPFNERAAYLDEACSGNEELRTEVEELLRYAHDDEETAEEEAESVERIPERIGPYWILEKLGQGGMGVVYLAEQTKPIYRLVALKVIKLGMDTMDVVARFKAERQALALMEHPAVAKVYEAATTDDGRPYFVMELVEGAPITEYCDSRRLNLRERLQLFIQVCRGLEHAHGKGIIHRDIKPSNILVAEVDGEPAPKIIDFGVAKATNQRLTERTIYTELGRAVGTPAYMSPEQAHLTGEDIDHRTDIYSLGVLLYELLVGELPIENETLTKAAFDEIMRRIREEEPPTPSVRLSRLNVERSSKLALRRNTRTTDLKNQLRADLDWITMKALDKDRNRRYRTAQDLATDIERHLRGETVLARPPSVVYRVNKFVRRNRGAVAATAILFVALSVALAMSLFGWRKSEQALRALRVTRQQIYFNNIMAASFHLEYANVAESRRRLEDCPPEFRGWEWHHLNLKRARSLRVISGHEGFSIAVAFSPDRTRLATASKRRGSTRRNVLIWDTEEAVLRETTGDHQGVVNAVAFSPDGKRVVSGSEDKTVRLWEVGQKGQIPILYTHEDKVLCVAFSANGKLIASGAADGKVQVWDLLTKKTIATLTDHEGAVSCIAISPDGERVVCADKRTVRLWRIEPPELITAHRPWAEANAAEFDLLTHEYAFSSVLFSPNGKRIAAAAFDGLVRLWDTETGNALPPLQGHERYVWSVDFSPDGKRIVSGSKDKTVRIWNVETSTVQATLHGHENHVTCVAFGPEGRLLFSRAADGTVRVWDGETTEVTIPLPGHQDYLCRVAFSTGGEVLCGSGYPRLQWDSKSKDVSGKTFGVRVWNEAGLPLGTSSCPDRGACALAFSRDGRLVASSSKMTTALLLWKANDGKVLTRLQGHEEDIFCADFSADGKRIVSGSRDGTARVWDVATGRCLATTASHGSRVYSVAFSHDGQQIATGSEGTRSNRAESVRVWDAETANLVMTLAGAEMRVYALAFSPDGERIAAASQDRKARVWDVRTQDPLAVFHGHEGKVYSVAFSPDGRRVLTGSQDGTVRLWKAETGELLLSLREHEGEVFSVAFSPDGRRIASASEDLTVRLWESELSDVRKVWHGLSQRAK